mmetsp:Transcript_63251/g.124587  ORF Transcript_63251/g.124587 Transcript_63251/m.124587 type:complete len:209 (+) Transcript_63251:129-755(+)
MGGKQSQPAEPAPARPTLQEASAKIDDQVATLDLKISKADNDAKQWVAKAATNPTAKARAMQCLKMKKQYEAQRDQLMNTQFNLNNMAFQQEQAEVTAAVVAGMAAGRDQLKAMQDKINVETVDKLTDDLAEISDEMRAIQEALAGSGTGVAADDGELEAEWERMQEQAAMEKLMQGQLASSSAAPAPAAPAAAAAAPVAAPPHPVAA